MRHFDVASRDRDRVTLLGSVSPFGNLTANASLAIGKDDYLESEFGLRDNNHHVYSRRRGLPAEGSGDPGGVVTPTSGTTRCHAPDRQATPPSSSTPHGTGRPTAPIKRIRSWSTWSIARIAEKVDLHLAYDFSRTRAIYNYITGPVPDRTLPEEVIVPSSLPTPTELPPTLSELQRATADVTYPLSARLSVGLSYWVRTIPGAGLHAGYRRQSRARSRPGAAHRLPVSAVHSAHGLGTTRVSLVRALRTWGSCTFNLATVGGKEWTWRAVSTSL